MDFKAAIFDLDGTLLDSMPAWERIALKWAKRHGIKLTPELLHTAKYGDFRDLADYMRRSYPRINMKRTIFFWGLRGMWLYMTEITLKEGVYDYLSKLKSEGVKLAIATSCPKKLCMAALSKNRIRKFFSAFSFSEHVKRNKAFPDVFLDAADKLGVAPEDCMVYEDSYVALGGVRAAGMKVTAVYDESALHSDKMAEEADRFIRSFKELL